MGARTRASTLNERREKNFGAVHAAQMDDGMDEKIRVLLTACFTGPQDAVFQTRRYFNDPYPHRWIVRDDRGALPHMSACTSGAWWRTGDVMLEGSIL